MGEPARELRAISSSYLAVPRALLTAGLTANEAALYALLWEEAGFRAQTVKVNAFLLAAKLGADPRSVRKWMNTLDARRLIEVADRPEGRREYWMLYVCEVSAIDSPQAASRPDPQMALPGVAAESSGPVPQEWLRSAAILTSTDSKLSGDADGSNPERFAHFIPGSCAQNAQNVPASNGVYISAHARARKSERENDCFNKAMQSLSADELKEAANRLYRDLDKTQFPWIALSAILAVEQGWLTQEELDNLVALCRRAKNFGKRLKASIGNERWKCLTVGNLKILLPERGLAWEPKWEYAPENPRAP